MKTTTKPRQTNYYAKSIIKFIASVSIVITTVGFFLAAFCFASEAVQAQDWADRMFPVKSHDFGVASQFQSLEFRFPMKNLYVEDVRIGRVSSSCNCTTVYSTQEAIKTGEVAYIVARINSSRFLGEKGAKITVEIVEPFPAVVELFDHVRIIPEGTVLAPPAPDRRPSARY